MVWFFPFPAGKEKHLSFLQPSASNSEGVGLGQAQVPKDAPLIPHAEKRQGAVPKGMPKFAFPFLEYQCSLITKSLKQLIK